MSKFIAFFRLIRWGNLLFIIAFQSFFFYLIILPELQTAGLEATLDHLHFVYLVLSTILMASAGYIINDYFDVNIDRMNKPEKLIIDKYLSRKQALNLHYAFNIMGIIVGFYLGWKVGEIKLGYVYVLSAGLLWFYSSAFKRQFVIGNIIISLMTALLVILVVLFERQLFTAYSTDDMVRAAQRILYLMAGYAVFAFITTWIREIVKDIQDEDGDREEGCNTMPILLGIRNTKIITVIITMILMACLAYVQEQLFNVKAWSHFLYALVALQLPLLAFIILLFFANTSRGFRNLSALMKVIMGLGVLSIPLFYWFNLA